MIALKESTRIGNVITLTFENGNHVEIPCPAALIGNPAARLIADAERWRTRPRRLWQLLDCPEAYEAELKELLEAMPVEGCFDCEPGWYGLVAEAWRAMRREDPACIVTEVKQKVGELRISCRNGAGHLGPELFEHCVTARKASETTCEWCAGETDSAPAVGSPSRLCAGCRDFDARWSTAWREASE